MKKISTNELLARAISQSYDTKEIQETIRLFFDRLSQEDKPATGELGSSIRVLMHSLLSISLDNIVTGEVEEARKLLNVLIRQLKDNKFDFFWLDKISGSQALNIRLHLIVAFLSRYIGSFDLINISKISRAENLILRSVLEYLYKNRIAASSQKLVNVGLFTQTKTAYLAFIALRKLGLVARTVGKKRNAHFEITWNGLKVCNHIFGDR